VKTLATRLRSLTLIAHEGTLRLVTSATSDLHEQSGQDTAAARGFDAFLSYSHAADGRLAPALQTALQSIGKPWYRRRALRVFRDTTTLSASPELWPAIERALERSRHFILLVSPDSAASPWVDQEVGWWRAHRESATCLIALTAGELGWDERRADLTAESSVPPSLRGWFPSEPLWIDLRWAHDEDHLSTRNPTFRDAAATLAAPLRGIDKDELVGEDIRQHRRALRLARAAVALLALLTIAAVAAGIFAQIQRGRAERQAREATSLALSSTASQLVQARPDVALLLAFEAYTTSPRNQARSSVLSALAGARDPGVVAILHGHTDDVQTIAFSPDGRTLASGAGGLGDDHTIRLWDVGGHRPLGNPITGHGDDIDQLAFSRDGRTLASASGDHTVRFWNVRTQEQLGAPLRGDPGTTGNMLSSDGRTFTVATGDGVELRDLRSRKLVGVPIDSAEESAVLRPDGRLVATFSPDSEEGTIQLWDVRTRRRLGPPLRHPGEVTDVVFSRDGRKLASFGWGRSLVVWNVARRTQIGPAPPGTRYTAAAFSPDGRSLAVADNRTIQLLDSRGRFPIAEPLAGHADLITGLAFSPDGRLLASSSYDDTVRLWDVRNRSAFGTPLAAHFDWVHSVAFSPDGRTLASAGRDEYVLLWNVRTKQTLGDPLEGHSEWLNSVAFSPDGRTLASASDDGSVRLWNARSGKLLGEPIRGHGGNEVTGVAFSPDGRLLVSSGFDGRTRFWDVRTRKQVGRPLRNPVDETTGTPDPGYGVAFSPDGTIVATEGTADAAIRLWDVRTRKQVGNALQTNTNGIGGIAFSPDGQTIAAGTDGGTIQFWDVPTRTRRASFAAHGDADGVSSVAFSPDGHTLASASWDHTVRLWDVATHEPVGPPLQTGTQLSTVAFSADGAVAAAGEDGTVWLWTGLLWRDDKELESIVCPLVGGGLSEAEWARYASAIPHRNSCD
jgi:WD40 repeat protein